MSSTLQTSDQDRQRLIDALKAIWNTDATVRVFHLQLDVEHIKSMYGGWVVPVFTTDDNGDAWDLVRAISRLEEEASKRTQLSVSLLLDPGFSD